MAAKSSNRPKPEITPHRRARLAVSQPLFDEAATSKTRLFRPPKKATTVITFTAVAEAHVLARPIRPML